MVPKRRVHGDEAGGAYAFGPQAQPSSLRLRVESGTVARQPSRGPSLAGLIDLLTRALAGGRHAAALELVQQLLGLEPDEPRWHQQHGDVLRRLDRLREAAVAYRIAARRYGIQGLAEHASALHRIADQLEGLPSSAQATELSPPEPSSEG